MVGEVALAGLFQELLFFAKLKVHVLDPNPFPRHCKRSEAIQAACPELDRFVAELVIGPATSGRARRLPAMTRMLSQAQDRFRDDLFLNLIRAAIDRNLAVVEILRGERAGPVGPD